MPVIDLLHPQLAAYQSAVEEPADFDDFWRTTISEARNLAGDPVVVPQQTGIKALSVEDVSFSGFGGQPIKAWLIRPHASPGEKLPAIIHYVGYGGGRGFPHEALHWAASGYACLRMDTRGQGSSLLSVGGTPDPEGGTHPSASGVMTRGINSPEDYYYRRLFTDAVRAVDVVGVLPGIDPDRIAVFGRSQGGATALAVAGLDPRIRAVISDVPFLCDFPRALQIATQDPYAEVVRYLAAHRDAVARTLAVLAYFDGINFSRRAQAPALFSAALMDTVCPPSTVYGAYNAYAGKRKSIVDYPFNNHEGGGAHHEALQMNWLSDLLA
ncbi:MAG: alpha/beta fold hydrolase [Nitratireductor sp.]